MNGHQIDELLKRKVDNARRGRTLRTVALVLVLLALVVLIGTAIHRHKTKAVNVPDAPSEVEAEEEPAPEDEPEAENTQVQEGQKPLQPEEMRRQENKHVLVLQWVGVPEEEKPPIVTITVLHRGEEVARFTLSEESEWRHSWSDNYPAETLSLRAELPKSVMASFTLRGNQFTVLCSGGSAIPASTAAAAETEQTESSDEEAGEETEAEAETGETSSEEEAPGEAQTEEEAPSEAQPEEEAPGEAEADGEGETNEISSPPRSSHSWWPIVLLLLCGAVLVTLGVLGTDRRRSR